LVFDEVLDDDELLESDEVPDEDELLEEEVLLVEFELLEPPLASDSKSSTIVTLPEPLELPDALDKLLKPPPGGGPPKPPPEPPAPPGPLANALEKIFCNSLA
jgi:hypothetical protein